MEDGSMTPPMVGPPPTVTMPTPVTIPGVTTVAVKVPATTVSVPPGSSPPEEGHILIRVHVPELNVQKCLQFPRDELVWDVKQQCLAALPKVRDVFVWENHWMGKCRPGT
ncbi:hypothetical protein J437_LFUL003961 [Ladona fulva]|uniref:Uncharacterized protein n=1 Tax=Ladona fulva TaxID=123851 RepID=A0A8K0JTA3_LADFU|nr:hypothetical protein J437_LFUL003961 [Ladona fulva]